MGILAISMGLGLALAMLSVATGKTLLFALAIYSLGGVLTALFLTALIVLRFREW